jgi:hypothetical protein
MQAPAASGGGKRVRTDDLLLAKQALSQLSYAPSFALRASEGKPSQRRCVVIGKGCGDGGLALFIH